MFDFMVMIVGELKEYFWVLLLCIEVMFYGLSMCFFDFFYLFGELLIVMLVGVNGVIVGMLVLCEEVVEIIY